MELDGNAAHPAEGRWRDTRRDNANLAQGVRTLRYGWPDVTEYRCRTAAEIADPRRQGYGCAGGPTCTWSRRGNRGRKKQEAGKSGESG